MLKRKTQNHNENTRTDLRYRSYKYSVYIIKFLERLPNSRLYWVISDQLLRSATSIGANIMEAKSASSKKDFARFYDIALKSANETKYWICLLRDTTNTDKEYLKQLLNESEGLSKMLGASLLTMRNKR
ncbi:MAG: hypothetical protein Athens071416_241 [Parcubacteria group bacterium Athens0714_16]|nr:MAG: hypothetical protein Athens071416_241 [Parcubacteria group bacterium Athens0714_16]